LRRDFSLGPPDIEHKSYSFLCDAAIAASKVAVTRHDAVAMLYGTAEHSTKSLREYSGNYDRGSSQAPPKYKPKALPRPNITWSDGRVPIWH
jgi:hypothetical protein